MTGIRKRITIGFLSMVVLLFFSGLVSLYELNHMSTDIESILKGNRRSMELSENMLDAIRANDRAVITYAVLRDTLYADSCRTSFDAFRAKLSQARTESNRSAASLFDSLSGYSEQMRHAFEQLLASRAIEHQLLMPDSIMAYESFDGRRWYEANYLPAYNKTSSAIMRVMSDARTSLTPRAERLSRNAYRAVTPVFISLVVMIAILLMFYYFVMIYMAKPIVAMNKSLGDSIRYKIPFDVKSECRDELLDLKEKIASVTNTPKK